VDAGIPLITDLQLARAIIEALRWRKPESQVLAWKNYLNLAQTTLLQILKSRSTWVALALQVTGLSSGTRYYFAARGV
jgi:hypothetical protein